MKPFTVNRHGIKKTAFTHSLFPTIDLPLTHFSGSSHKIAISVPSYCCFTFSKFYDVLFFFNELFQSGNHSYFCLLADVFSAFGKPFKVESLVR